MSSSAEQHYTSDLRFASEEIQKSVIRAAKVAVRITGGADANIRTALREAARTDSPIEAIFSAVFTVARNHLLAQVGPRFAVALRPQLEVDHYRLDFAIEPMDPWLRDALKSADIRVRVGVELDGHEFHERTKQQVADRDRRDRYLSGIGWRVLHFSGSELHRNPMDAVVEVLVTAADALDQAKAALIHG